MFTTGFSYNVKEEYTVTQIYEEEGRRDGRDGRRKYSQTIDKDDLCKNIQ